MSDAKVAMLDAPRQRPLLETELGASDTPTAPARPRRQAPPRVIVAPLLLWAALAAAGCSRHPTYGRPTPRDTIPTTTGPDYVEPRNDPPPPPKARD